MLNYQINWEEINQEQIKLLSDLIKIDTTNPPGGETAACEYLAEIFSKEKISFDILEKEKGRGNFVARIKGNEKNKPILLLSHLDVVGVEKEKWSVDPFAGKLQDGYIWGRGALDCKHLVVQEAMLLLLLKRLNLKLNRDIIFAAVADEEKGGHYGAEFLVSEHFAKIQSEFAINEGGGIGIELGKNKKMYYLCATGEKGICWLKLKTKGDAGHGSMPVSNNAIVHMCQAILKIARYHPPVKITSTLEGVLKVIGKQAKISPAILKTLLQSKLSGLILEKIKDDGMRRLLKAILANSFSPTVIKAGYKTNIIPSECEAEIDCRILPGETKNSVLHSLKKILQNIPVEIEITEFFPATESETENNFYHIIVNSTKKNDAESKVMPFMLTGATDSRFLRRKGIPAYGFSPFKVEGSLKDYLQLYHGHNERISLENLLFGTKVLFSVLEKIALE